MLTPVRTLTQGCRAVGACILASLVLAILALPPLAWAAERVGVVTMLLGFATITRAALSAPATLGFKDDVLLHDRITTGERSVVRVLLGGKATVTARERSVLTITEVPGVATVQLGAGRISVAVSKALMKPGEVIEIKTPNAVAAIRGTVVVAEVSPGRSTITILRGLVEVTKLDPVTGRRVGPAVKVGARERVAVTDAGPVPAPEAITPEAANRLAADFTFLPKHPPAASLTALNQAATQASIVDATQTVKGIVTPGVSSLTGGASTTAAIGAASGAVGTVATTTTGSASAVGPLDSAVGSLGSAATSGSLPTTASPLIPTGTNAPGTVATTPTGSMSAVSPLGGAVTGGSHPTTTASPLIPTVTNTVTNGLLGGLPKR